MPVNREKRKEVIKIFVRRQFRSIPGRLEKKKALQFWRTEICVIEPAGTFFYRIILSVESALSY